MTQTKTKTARITEGRTLYTIDHNGEELTFEYPAYGPGTYFQVGDQIQEAQEAGLSRPTMSQTSSLVHAAFNAKNSTSL